MNGIPVKTQQKAAILGLETQLLVCGRNRFMVILKDGQPVSELLTLGYGKAWLDGYAVSKEVVQA